MMVRATPSWSLSYSVMAVLGLGVDHGYAMARCLQHGDVVDVVAERPGVGEWLAQMLAQPRQGRSLGGALVHDLDIHGVRTRDLDASERVERRRDSVAIGRVVPVHGDAFECLDLVDLAVDIHVDRRSCALERSRDVGVAATEFVQARVERAGEEALSVGEDVEGDVVAGGDAIDAVGDAAIERTAQNARGARGVSGHIVVELPDTGAISADGIVHGGMGEDGLKDARQWTSGAGHKFNPASSEFVEHCPGGVAHLLITRQQRSVHIGKHNHLMQPFLLA